MEQKRHIPYSSRFQKILEKWICRKKLLIFLQISIKCIFRETYFKNYKKTGCTATYHAEERVVKKIESGKNKSGKKSGEKFSRKNLAKISGKKIWEKLDR